MDVFGKHPDRFDLYLEAWIEVTQKKNVQTELSRLVSKSPSQNLMGNNHGHCSLCCIITDSLLLSGRT